MLRGTMKRKCHALKAKKMAKTAGFDRVTLRPGFRLSIAFYRMSFHGFKHELCTAHHGAVFFYG
jgi:hypothetical protein